MKEIEIKEIPYWYPKNKISKNAERYIRSALQLRAIETLSDFYTKRNLWALARLWEESLRSKFPSQLTFVLTSIILRAAKITRYNFGRRGNGIITGTLYVSSFPVENNILWICEKKFCDCLPALKIGQEDACYTSSFHAGQLKGLPDNAVDYIFTDPPFGSNIFYGDCSFLWESWLQAFTDDAKEAVWNKSRKPNEGGKTLEDYKRLMSESFQEMYRVLKPNRWATVVFSNSDDGVWEAIQDAAQQAGFIIYGGKEFDKTQRSFKGIKGEKGQEKVISKDVLLNLHKPRILLITSLNCQDFEVIF